jgi:hypothetical protein
MVNIGFQINILGALSVGNILLCIIPYLLPSQNYYLKAYKSDKDSSIGELKNA